MTQLTKIAARKKIVKHLRRRGHVADFKVTPILVMRWWNLLNNAIFDGKLTPPRKIVCREFRDQWGACKAYSKKGEVCLEIASDFFDRKQFLAVLAHEMIHQWQWTEESCKGKITHGKTFWRWKKHFKDVFNLPLEISY